jgi:3-methyladenine DNA glycosylase AlkD
MSETVESAAEAAHAFIREADALASSDIKSVRAIRQAYSRAWREHPAGFVHDVALTLVERDLYAWAGYELVRFHRGAFRALADETVQALGRNLGSWDGVDAFARTLSGPAWAHGLVSDGLIDAWSHSPDRWLRRAAVVSTIALNRPKEGGKGDTKRTLAICRRLAADRDDMVEKALSWALRELSKLDPAAVAGFLRDEDARLGARVKREVGNKLRTGFKNPRPPRG